MVEAYVGFWFHCSLYPYNADLDRSFYKTDVIHRREEAKRDLFLLDLF